MADGTANPEILRRLDRSIWALVAMVAAIVLAAPLVSSFHIEWRSLAPTIAGTLVLCAGAWFYRNWRPDLRLASGLRMHGAARRLHGRRRPSLLSRGRCRGRDPAAGFHVRRDRSRTRPGLAGHAVLDERVTRGRNSVLTLSYMSFTLQATITVLALAFFGQLVRIRDFHAGADTLGAGVHRDFRSRSRLKASGASITSPCGLSRDRVRPARTASAHVSWIARRQLPRARRHGDRKASSRFRAFTQRWP